MQQSARSSRITTLAAVGLVVCALASAQNPLSKELADYRYAQAKTFDCSTDFTVARLDGSTYTQAYACIKAHQSDVQAKFKPILDAAPSSSALAPPAVSGEPVSHPRRQRST
jgi:hypothetical protein